MKKKDVIIRLLKEGWTHKDIVAHVTCSKSTVSFHAKNLGLGKGPRAKHDWKEIQRYYDECQSLTKTAKHFKTSRATLSDGKRLGKLKAKNKKIPTAELLVSDRSATCRTHLKNRLLKENLLKDRCYECSLTHWNGRKLSLQLHHVNGKKNDNRLENLQLLCPNCHSLTSNYAGRNMNR